MQDTHMTASAFLSRIFGRGATVDTASGRFMVLHTEYTHARQWACGGVEYQGIVSGPSDRLAQAVEVLL